MSAGAEGIDPYGHCLITSALALALTVAMMLLNTLCRSIRVASSD
jgi:hypothetical protein